MLIGVDSISTTNALARGLALAEAWLATHFGPRSEERERGGAMLKLQILSEQSTNVPTEGLPSSHRRHGLQLSRKRAMQGGTECLHGLQGPVVEKVNVILLVHHSQNVPRAVEAGTLGNRPGSICPPIVPNC